MLHQIKKHPLILGTVLLTGAGLISRILGFFYRIFLSRTIGASGLGLYQLIFPIFTLCLAVCASGIQTSISRFVASAESKNIPARYYLYMGLGISVGLSVLFSMGIYLFAPWIASDILKEPRTGELLRLVCFALTPACVHACFNGYYYGKSNSYIPSICQIIEQTVRILGTLLIYQILTEQHLPLEPIHAVWGLVISELAGFLVNITAYIGYGDQAMKNPSLLSPNIRSQSFTLLLLPLMQMALPLTTNHVLMTLSHSVEHLMLPQQLLAYGYSSDEALSHFGILTGMSMSVILFPGVITNSLSVLLLPRIAEAKAKGDSTLVTDTIKGALCCGLALGSLCTFIFLFSSDWIGTYIFDNKLAGYYVQILSILCPFMYTASLLASIVNGLGYAKLSLGANLLGCGARLLSILLLVPRYGMYAYIFSMIGAAILTVAALLIALYFLLKKGALLSL